MKFTEISPYTFPSGNEIGFLTNMSNYDEKSDFVKLHEETILENEISLDAQVVDFEPIVMALDPNVVIDTSSKTINSNRFFLLDGHHRWKFAKNKNYINKLKCILVNFSDVKIKSYAFNSSNPLANIAAMRITEATHLTYQSKVYLGVALLNILFEFCFLIIPFN